MHKMYFNTGVRPENRTNPTVSLREFESWRGGTLHIEYHLLHEPPPGWVIQHLADQIQPNETDRFIPIVGGGMNSKFAIFTKPKGDTHEN